MVKSKKDLKIVFMGTPAFAVTVLERLVSEEYTIMAVVTAPDRPAGRGRKLRNSAVKDFALQHELKILQPDNMKSKDFIDELESFQADLFIVVAFRMLPKVIWNMPKMGTFNLHGSLLPQYRGAAPINWAIINGETVTGVTSFFLDENIDTGEIIMNREISIGENESAGDLHDKMMFVAADVVLETIELIRNNKAKPQPQPKGKHQPAPKIQKQDCFLDFNLSIPQLYNFIRGMSPYPTAWIQLKHLSTEKEKSLKIFKSSIYNNCTSEEISLRQQDGKLLLTIKTGTLALEEIQLEGKKRLNANEFLSGFKPEEWQLVYE